MRRVASAAKAARLENGSLYIPGGPCFVSVSERMRPGGALSTGGDCRVTSSRSGGSSQELVEAREWSAAVHGGEPRTGGAAPTRGAVAPRRRFTRAIVLFSEPRAARRIHAAAVGRRRSRIGPDVAVASRFP